MKKYFNILVLMMGAGLMACSSSSYTVQSEQIVVQNNDEQNALSDLLAPYADSLNEEMNEVLATAEENFVISRNPSGTMNNWFSDAIFVNQTQTVRLSIPVMALFNNGGIRNIFSKGEITKGDVFKVMPFDNQVVWVKMPVAALKDIHAYILNSGGETVSNAIVTKDGIEVGGMTKEHAFFWIITSDYLLNGGDKMTFFKQKEEFFEKGVLLRDVLLEQVKAQGVLQSNDENRMQF
ncbi:MAG: 5'-nucleotidase [Bacteroidota bacterium]